MWSVPDWRTDEMYTELDNREQGIYRNLIDECWTAGSISADPEILARFAREPLEYFALVWLKIGHKFRRLSNGRLTSKRLQEDRRRLTTARQQAHNKASTAASERWRKHREAIKLHATSMSQALLGDAQIQTQTQIQNKEGEGNIKPLAIASPVVDATKTANSASDTPGAKRSQEPKYSREFEVFWMA